MMDEMDEKLKSLDWVEESMTKIFKWTEEGGALNQSVFSNFYFNATKYCTTRVPQNRDDKIGVGMGMGMGMNMGGMGLAYPGNPMRMSQEFIQKPRNATNIHKRFSEVVLEHIQGINKKLEGLVGYPYMEAYKKEWNRMTRAMAIINNCLKAMNSQWGTDAQKQGVAAHTAFLVAVEKWKEEMLDGRTQLSPFVVDYLKRDRNGEAVDVTLLKAIIDSLVSIASVDPKPCESLQEEIMSATEYFYLSGTAAFLQQNSFSDYLKKAEIRILQEENRIDQYLGEGCRAQLFKTVNHALVCKQQNVYLEHFPIFLEERRLEEIRRIYFLVSKAEPTSGQPLIPLIVEQFERFVVETGTKALTGKRERFVNSILEVEQFFKEMLTTCFNNDHIFSQAFDLGCRKFINKFEGGVAPKLLASFADRILKKTEKMDDEDRLSNIDSIILVMKHLDEKDQFMTFFGNCLSKRLINNLCAGDHRSFEKKTIEKMKMISGRDHVAGLNQMMNDMETSEELMGEFLSKRKRLPISCSTLFLTSGIWSKVAEDNTNITLPAKMLECKDVVEKMYRSKFSSRYLRWAHHLSSGTARLTFAKGKDGKEKDYEINCSGYMLVLLELFNRKTIRDFKMILDETNIPEQSLRSLLGALVSPKVKLLNRRPPKEEITMKTQFCLNAKFYREGREISVMVKDIKKEQKEDVNARRETEKARMHEIQACVVRILKAKKVMEHRLLIPEVMSHLQDRFKPEISKIKQCIDILIEKDYIERDEKGGNKYRYIS